MKECTCDTESHSVWGHARWCPLYPGLKCSGWYTDFQGLRRPCLQGGEGCGLAGCEASHGPMGGW